MYDLEDPARPRFTLAELKDILQERNSLKVGRLPVCNLFSVTLFTNRLKKLSFPLQVITEIRKHLWVGLLAPKDSFCHQKSFAPFILHLRNLKHVLFDEQFSDNFP